MIKIYLNTKYFFKTNFIFFQTSFFKAILYWKRLAWKKNCFRQIQGVYFKLLLPAYEHMATTNKDNFELRSAMINICPYARDARQ